ncbi:MAG: glycoside hydrolase family 127 protein [Phycisphaerae bacterium]|nr:glycoside hydrolase family 127 protein [Phycisphaerae bacterium]
MMRMAVEAITGLLALVGSGGTNVIAASPDLAVPATHMKLEGPMAARLDGIIRNWLIPAPDANPGMLEMMRLRDRKPPYEDPVPWAGEFAGKYLTSCVRACRMSDDPALREVTSRVMRELIRTQAQDGYLGPFPDHHLLGRWDLWGHYHCMLAMFLWWRDTGDADALQAATRAADLMCATFLDTGKRVYDAGSYEMNMAVIHVLGMLHRQTKNDDYLRLVREIEQDWHKPGAGDYHRLALQGIEFYQTPKPRWESLHLMAGLAELFRITGDDSYRQALVHWWGSIYRTDVHNSGSFSTNEQAVGNPFQSGAIETCCTVAWLALSVETLRLTADSRIADALEHATWNAVLGYEHPSGRWCTYDTPMNGKRLASAHSIVFQSRPGTPELNCCSVNGANGLGLLSEWATLGGTKGLYLNYCGPGTINVTLDDGSKWSFTQTTTYPAGGRIDIEVRPAKATALPLLLRIPEWSQDTKVAINGAPVEQVTPGSYVRIERTWSPGDRIEIDLDLRVRALRGDEHVQFNTSLFRGPILLAFDQKHNAMDPADMPELDLDSLALEPLPADDAIMRDKTLGPIVAFAAKGIDGRRVVLCDFGSAGAYGTYYRSWLPVRNSPPAPFTLVQPEDDARLPPEDLRFIWTRGEPGSQYEVWVWDEQAGQDSARRQTGLTTTEFEPTWQLAPARTYRWQVTAKLGQVTAPSTNGPLSFVVDPTVPSTQHGVVLRATLAGNAEPQDGALLLAQKVEPAPGPRGESDTALRFNGRDSKLVYTAPWFPLRTYTMAAWMRPEDLGSDGNRWHHVFSAWCVSVNDPLRVSVQDGKLVVNIEQPGGGCHLDAGPVQNGKWLHVAVVKKYHDLTLYVDGRRVATTSAPNTLASGPKNVGIGCNPNFGDTESFQGCIADVLFSREAMTDAQIAALAAGSFVVTP